MSSYENFYEQISRKITKCPITGQEGQPMPDNPLVWYVVYKGRKGERRTSYWSYSTGRIVCPSAEDTNVL